MGASSSDLVRKEVKLRRYFLKRLTCGQELKNIENGARLGVAQGSEFSAEEIPVNNNMALERR